ncbi:MAG TPA: cellulase family glycosylhydrolase [Thermoleophilaceae bacterium]
MTRLRTLALVLALSLVAALGTASSASAAEGMELALQDDGAFVTQEYPKVKHAKAFPLIKDLNVTWLRVNIGWAGVIGSKAAKARTKPSNVQYDFTSYDTLINAAQANGVNLEVGLTGSAPAWATADKKVGPNKPNAKLFREFVQEAVDHLGPHVDRWSIWNEPNHIGWISPLKSQASIYRSLYTTGYSVIKAADPTDEVLIGETAPYASRKGVATPPLEFLRNLTKSGTLRADGYAHHPYDFTHKPTYKYPGKDNVTLSGLSKLTKALDALTKKKKLTTPEGGKLDLYLTEFGYLRSGKQKQSESNRAKYIRQGYDMALKNPRVRQMLHFLLVQPASKYRFFDTSLVSQSGGRTPTYNALRDWAEDNLSRIAAPVR